MSTPELSRIIDRRGLPSRPVRLTASGAECAALARRFGLVAITRLQAEVECQAEEEVIRVTGRLEAEIVQPCAVSGEDLPVAISEPLALTFVPASQGAGSAAEEEIELEAEELDEIPYEGTAFDLGEALAQTLALAIDPYATGPEADATRREHGLLEEGAAGPLAEALKGLQGKT